MKKRKVILKFTDGDWVQLKRRNPTLFRQLQRLKRNLESCDETQAQILLQQIKDAGFLTISVKG